MQKVFVGIDIGSVSAKIAAMGESGEVVFKESCRVHGRPADSALELLKKIRFEVSNVIVTGSGAASLKCRGYKTAGEFKAIVKAVSVLYPEVRTIFEMGGETSKFIRIEIPPNPPLSHLWSVESHSRGVKAGGEGAVITEYGINGDCAAGTGSFIDQQAERLHYNVQDIGGLVCDAKRCARVAGRCSVFAKSDMIHAQQKGYSPPEVLKGLCLAVARNFKASVVKGRHVEPNVAFIGGLSLNKGVVSALKEVFDLKDNDFIVPTDAEFIGAIGAAMVAQVAVAEGFSLHSSCGGLNPAATVSTLSPLSTSGVRFLRDQVKPYNFPQHGKVRTFLGIDIGSVSTNFVVIDEAGDLVMEIYTYTKARPVEVVTEGLKEIDKMIGDRIEVCGVGTTGSGRELIGELIGADVIKDEITAHKTGAVHICKKLTGETVDTIFEIGGQDAKYIRIENGVVTDFAMNEACAAGTGSFLEEQAGRLGISIKNQFAKMALSSTAPTPLGERCTVFMERDVNTCQRGGARKEDIVAGLAYSVATNYLNRVVRGRHIGEHIFFQGGTAYNDAVAAAFSQILGKTIIVPPHNGVIGAIGAALLAQCVAQDFSPANISRGGVLSPPQIREPTPARRRVSGGEGLPYKLGNDMPNTRFRGFDLGQVSYTMREFACNACTNQCDIQEFNVEGEKTHWGDKCSTRFRKKARTENKPVIEDLFKVRNELVVAELPPEADQPLADALPNHVAQDFSPANVGRSSATTTLADKKDLRYTSIKIGIPRAMFFFDRFPFWRAYFETLGCEVVTSDDTNKTISHDSLELSVSEPCYPIKLANGHVKNLIDKGVDYIFIPNVISSERATHCIPYLCPWHQTLPYVVMNVPSFEGKKFLTPTIQFELGPDFVERCLRAVAKELCVSKKRGRQALEAAYLAQREFNKKIFEHGRQALYGLASSNADAIVLVGRPYNIYDLAANLNVPTKLREFYGMNVIPFDFLPVDEVDISDLAPHMFWNYGRKIVAAAKFVASRPNLHMIYITNFKCGPDSFIKHFATWAANKPYLTLQFDEHANDAGTLTRLEAYLDSKRLLKNQIIRTSEYQNEKIRDQNIRENILPRGVSDNLII